MVKLLWTLRALLVVAFVLLLNGTILRLIIKTREWSTNIFVSFGFFFLRFFSLFLLLLFVPLCLPWIRREFDEREMVYDKSHFVPRAICNVRRMTIGQLWSNFQRSRKTSPGWYHWNQTHNLSYRLPVRRSNNWVWSHINGSWSCYFVACMTPTGYNSTTNMTRNSINIVKVSIFQATGQCTESKTKFIVQLVLTRLLPTERPINYSKHVLDSLGDAVNARHRVSIHDDEENLNNTKLEVTIRHKVRVSRIERPCSYLRSRKSSTVCGLTQRHSRKLDSYF